MLLLPVAGLILFFVLPLRVALPLYVSIVAIAVYARLAIAQTVQFPPRTGLESMAGQQAVAVTPLNPVGVISYRGEHWRAASGTPIKQGTRVRIVRVERRPEGFAALVAAE